MVEFKYHTEAESEALDAFYWYCDKNNELGSSFDEELLFAEQQVSQHPNRWPKYLHGTRLFHLTKFPFALVYLVQPERILGIAVAHLHRKPGYWKDRLAH